MPTTTTTTSSPRSPSSSSSSDTNPTGIPTTGNSSTLEVDDSSSKRELLYSLQQEHDKDTKRFSLPSNYHDNDNDDKKGGGEDDRLGTSHGNNSSSSSSSSSSNETPQDNAMFTSLVASWKNSDCTTASMATNPTIHVRPDPPSSMMHDIPEPEATSNQTATIQTTTTTTTTSTTTTSTTEEQEDLIVAQARALALNAEKQLAKQRKSKATGLNMLMIHHHHHSDRDALPLGDLEQRKLIEAKLGQKKSNNKLDPLLTSMKPLAGLADVRTKFEGFFQEQQQKLEESLSSHFENSRIGHSSPTHHHYNKTTGSHNHSGGRSGGSGSGGGSGSRGGSANPSPIHHPSAKVKHPHNQEEREHDGHHQDVGLQSVLSSLDSTGQQRVQHFSTTTTNSTNRALNASSTSTSPSPTLSSIVYKRRSGYGKYSTKNAWERRRMDLVGTTLRYFADVTVLDPHDNKGTTATASTTARPSSEATVGDLDLGANASRINDGDNGNVVLSSAPSREDNMSSVGVTVSSKPKKDIRFLWEQAKENITKTTETLATSLSQNSHQNLDPNAPRGSIDLIKENAIVAAMSVTRSGVDSYLNSSNSISISNNGSNHTPTPFGICIVVKNEVKWKICFDSQREQMQWLAVLTEMIVQHNVNMYNEGLTLSRSRRGTTSTSSHSGRGRLSQTSTGSSGTSAPHSGDDRETVDNNNNNNNNETTRDIEATNTTDEIFHGPPGGNEHDLWQLDQKYSLTSLFNISKSTNPTTTGATTVESREKEGTEIDVKDNVGVNCHRKSISKSPFHAIYQVINDGASSGPSLSLTGNNVLILSCIFNIFIKIVHSLESGWSFWFSVLLSNVFFWLLVVNDSIRGEGQERISFLISFFDSPLRKSEDKGFSHASASRDKQSVTKTIDEVTKKVPMPVIKGFKPIAGSTTIRVKGESEPTTINGENFISWCVLPPDDVQVRSHGYLKTKKKVPSASALYEIIGCDILNSTMRLENISTLVKLPHMEFDDSAEEKTWNSPDVFAVSLAVPTEEPSMTRPSTDGEGLSVTVYYKMKKETRDILRKITGSGNESLNNEINVNIERSVVNAVKLWENWCTNAPHDEKMQARFKFIPNVHNPKEVGLPSYITKYCGKPVLIKRANVTGFLSTNPDINAMEFGISLHPFPYLAKKAMAYLKSTAFPKAIVSLSYVIEGRSDSELPEVLIGDALKLFYPNPELACDSDDFLAGAAKSSAATQIEDKFESTEDS